MATRSRGECGGHWKQRPTAKEIIPSIEVNALFPHKLALLCRPQGIRMVHMSTDCVFTGKKGDYHEDLSDAEDLYGKTKHLERFMTVPV
jgi:dTDP-4-dehydrorhamnose reductase